MVASERKPMDGEHIVITQLPTYPQTHNMMLQSYCDLYARTLDTYPYNGRLVQWAMNKLGADREPVPVQLEGVSG